MGRSRGHGVVPLLLSIVLTLAATACGETTPTPTFIHGTPTPTAGPSVTASPPPLASGACGAFAPGTPLVQANPACQAVWHSVGLTVVPPTDIAAAEGARQDTSVANHAGPTVTDAQAAAWTNSFTRMFAWYIFAETNVQPDLLSRVAGPNVISTQEAAALAAHTPIVYSPGCLAPGAAALFPLGADGKGYFSRHLQYVTSPYVVVVTLPLGCTGSTKQGSGQDFQIVNIPQGGRIINAGHFISTPVLGDLWFTDASLTCDATAPAAWCA